MDAKGFMNHNEFYEMLSDLNLTEVIERDNYDAVFHLVSAAKGAEEFYTLENNTARTETVEEAAAVDDRLIHAWTGHPHLRVIDNSTNFENKIKKLITEISSFLGEPEPLEIERKFLIEYPDIDWLENSSECKKIEIIQTYLKSGRDEEIRVRQRGMNGNYIYFKTIKRKVDDLKRIEVEKRLSKDEYLTLLMEADTEKRQIRKNRYCLMYNNQYFEIDVYPFWSDKAILEIELSDENTKIFFPEKIKIIKEVTDDENYKNASFAKI
jgi:CYTH domain-containing protein